MSNYCTKLGLVKYKIRFIRLDFNNILDELCCIECWNGNSRNLPTLHVGKSKLTFLTQHFIKVHFNIMHTKNKKAVPL